MEQQRKKVILYNLMLIIASAIWGGNFIFQKIVSANIGPFFFMSLRSFLGATAMLPIIYFEIKRKKSLGEPVIHYNKHSFLNILKVSLLCGTINVSGSVLVQWGLKYTNASKAGFLNAIYIVFVPILGFLFFKEKASKNMWWGVILATVGLYYLCIDQSFCFKLGDALILGSTVFFATHIHLISKFVKKFNGLHLSCLEFYCASLYCLICSFAFENPSFLQIEKCKYSILFAGILGIGVCYALQVTAQKYTNPTIAALLMSLESVFGAIGGVIFLQESFSCREILGILFIIIAIIIAELSPRSATSKTEDITTNRD